MGLQDPREDFRCGCMGTHSPVLCTVCWVEKAQGPLIHRLFSPPGDVTISDRSSNPFHISKDVDYFLLREQERTQAIAVSIWTWGSPSPLSSFPPPCSYLR